MTSAAVRISLQQQTNCPTKTLCVRCICCVSSCSVSRTISTTTLWLALVFVISRSSLKVLSWSRMIDFFLSHQIIHSTTVEFESELDSAQSLDDVIRIHNRFLKHLYGRCLQNKDIDILRELLIKVLNNVLMFCELWNGRSNRCDRHYVTETSSCMLGHVLQVWQASSGRPRDRLRSMREVHQHVLQQSHQARIFYTP